MLSDAKLQKKNNTTTVHKLLLDPGGGTHDLAYVMCRA